MFSARCSSSAFHQRFIEEPIRSNSSSSSSSSSKKWKRFPGRKEWESRTSKNAAKGKNCSIRISSILQSIESVDNVSEAMQPWAGKLHRKEQSQLLKELQDWPKALQVFGWFQDQENYMPDVFLYNIVLRILGKARQWEHVQNLWNQMLDSHLAPTNVTYSTLVDAYGRAGLRYEAMYFYKHMKEQGIQPDEVMISTFINLQRRFGDLEAAEEAFWGLVHGSNMKPQNPETYNTMLALYSEKNRYVEAFNVFQVMKEAQVQPTVVSFNTMINIYGKTGHIEDAENLVEKMLKSPGSTPDIATYNTLMEMYVKSSEMKLASDCLTRMRDAGVLPDQVTYRTLISGYASKGWVQEAENALKAMECSGFPVDQATYVQMMLTFIRIGDASKSLAIFEYLHRASCDLDVSTYVSVLDAYAEAGFLVEAEGVFDLWIRGKTGKTASVYNVMIKAYGLSGTLTKALEIFDNMTAAGVRPNEATFNSVIQLICKQGPVQELDRVLLQAREAGCVPSLACYSSMISLYAGLGLPKIARKAFNEMEKAGIKADIICYSALLNAYAEAGWMEEAQETLEMIKTAGFTPDAFVKTSLMKLYSNLGLVTEAKMIHDDMTRELDTYASNTMTSIYIRAGMFREAEKLFLMMQENGGMNEVVCTVMLNHYRDVGKMEQAILLVNQMQEKQLIKDVISYNSVISTYVKSGLMLEAVRALCEMRSRNFVANEETFSVFRGVLDRAGIPREAIYNLEDASELDMLVILGSLYSQADMIEEAVQIAGELEKFEDMLDVSGFNAMISSFGKAGMLDAALRAYTKMQRRGIIMNEATYASVIVAYGKAGLLEGVARMFKRLKQAGHQPSVSTYKRIIENYRDAGRMDLASMISQEMQFAQYVQSGMRSGLPSGLSELDKM